MISLTTVGELWANLPGSGYRTQLEANKGAPVSFHCPVPVPVSVNVMAILRGGNVNSAKLFVNWNQSKEGQIAQYFADASAPTHQALQNDDRFVPYAKNIAGKPAPTGFGVGVCISVCQQAQRIHKLAHRPLPDTPRLHPFERLLVSPATLTAGP